MTPGYTGDVTDKQSIFDFVWNFITEQGAPARTGDIFSGPGCRYRIEGRACAAGCLVPDSDYTTDFDRAAGGSGVRPTGAGTASCYFREKGYDLHFLSDLQRGHDCASPAADFVTSFHDLMRLVATKHNLIASAA